MRKIRMTLLSFALATPFAIQAQNGGHLSGDLMLNANFFNRDSTINASNNPLYDNLLSGGDAWMSLKYTTPSGFDAFLRVDAFHNSNLKNPTNAQSGFGIGAWSLSKSINKLHVTAGHIYDQIGSGLLFRSYEDRGLLIDNALVGARLRYDFNDNLSIKAFTGQQKNLFERYNPIIKGLNLEGNISISDDVYMTSGLGVLNRTLDKTGMSEIVTRVESMPVAKRFVPKYNMYALTAYNTLNIGDLSWYLEGAYKTKEAINNNNSELINKEGTALFSTVSYARPGFAVSLVGKRTENFVMRTSPSQTLLNGMLNWQPILAQIRPQRVIARYSPASQDLSEIGGSANLLISPNEDVDFTLAYTHINTLEKIKLYREVYAEANIRKVKNMSIDLGVQYLQYNQEFYQFKPGAGVLNSITPFTEIVYQIDGEHSLKFQGQYMHMMEQKDYGSWLYAGLEFAIAPKWSFAVSDMYNITPGKYSPEGRHYYNAFIAYTKDANRFTLSYAKQVEGVNCTGGVCRYEPAFSGVRFGVTSSF